MIKGVKYYQKLKEIKLDVKLGKSWKQDLVVYVINILKDLWVKRSNYTKQIV